MADTATHVKDAVSLQEAIRQKATRIKVEGQIVDFRREVTLGFH